MTSVATSLSATASHCQWKWSWVEKIQPPLEKLEPWGSNLGPVPNPAASHALVNQSIWGNISPDTKPTRIGEEALQRRSQHVGVGFSGTQWFFFTWHTCIYAVICMNTSGTSLCYEWISTTITQGHRWNWRIKLGFLLKWERWVARHRRLGVEASR